ncbi:RluA family pseudouridine synthase [Treponema pedis]|uniref:RluA family pseudouridine synthase n=1 Tax=Treponema pedis TaxID=409322 RepID=UPI0004679258|nr:RluA family pseudouridine synthase [Treponema pedis]QSI04859.1 RluA family pseudouridine synthase [Treponema pedis]
MKRQNNNSLPVSFIRKIKVENLSAPVRLDIYCAEKISELTRSQLKSGLKSLSVNSQKAKLSRAVNNGDLIEINWQNPVPMYAEPENIPLKIIYEDENIIAVNKNEGMVTHPAGGNWKGTLVNALNYYRTFNSSYNDEFKTVLNRLSEKKSLGINYNDTVSEKDLYRIGIVHRLDKKTSGIIITARNFKTEVFLKECFKKRLVKKYYLAIIKGCPKNKSGKVKTSVFRSKADRKKFKTSADLSCGKPALSAYKILKTNGEYSLAVFRIFTGRTHQIRLHSKFLGCPVLGDKIYGKKNTADFGDKLFLHSYKLVLNLNNSKKEFKAPLPYYFKKAMQFFFNE